MSVVRNVASIAAVSALLALGACATPAETHRHGPRGDAMRDAAMPEQPTQCPYDSATHNMNRPHDNGPMATAEHPACREQAAEAEASPPQAPTQPQ